MFTVEDMEKYLIKNRYAYARAYNRFQEEHEIIVKTDTLGIVILLNYNRCGGFRSMYELNCTLEGLVDSYIKAGFACGQFTNVKYHDDINLFKLKEETK